MKNYILLHKKETIEKMTRANNLLKYMNNVGKGMEINTALLLYKVLRTALGYRNSAPKNVILEEAKIVNLRERG